MKQLVASLELPGDIFDAEFPESDFLARLRELAILELLRVRRLHEHEALRMLGVDRPELLRRMEAAGIAPTEKLFGAIKHELDNAVAASRRRRGTAVGPGAAAKSGGG